MSCQEYWATAEEYLDFWCINPSDCEEADQVENYLRRSASTINMALQASGACDCTFTSASTQYLRDLSIVLAVVYHACPCARPKISVEEKRMYHEQVTEELRQIRTGEMELCSGHTGSDFPAVGWAQQGWTPWATAEIIYNEETS